MHQRPWSGPRLDVLAACHGNAELVAAAIRTTFAESRQFARVNAMHRDGAEDLPAPVAFPSATGRAGRPIRRKGWSRR
jgi:hypothetical protein